MPIRGLRVSPEESSSSIALLTYVLNSDAGTEGERLPPRSVPFPQSSTFELRPYGHCPNYTTGHVFICICFRFTLCSNSTLIYLLLSSCTLISISSMSSWNYAIPFHLGASYHHRWKSYPASFLGYVLGNLSDSSTADGSSIHSSLVLIL